MSWDGPWNRMERPGIGDWDGDGTPDVITRFAPGEASQASRCSRARRPKRIGFFDGPEFAHKRCLCCGDYNHDGKSEALVADGAGWSAFLLGQGLEEPLATLQDDGEPPEAGLEEEMSCAAAFVPDMDGDKRDDIVFVRPAVRDVD